MPQRTVSTKAADARQRKVSRLNYNEKVSTSVSTTVTDEPKRMVKRPWTEDEKNASCDERKSPEANNVPDNLPHATSFKMPDQHSLTRSNISSGSINGTLTSSVNSTSTNNVDTSDSNNLSKH